MLAATDGDFPHSDGGDDDESSPLAESLVRSVLARCGDGIGSATHHRRRPTADDLASTASADDLVCLEDMSPYGQSLATRPAVSFVVPKDGGGGPNNTRSDATHHAEYGAGMASRSAEELTCDGDAVPPPPPLSIDVEGDDEELDLRLSGDEEEDGADFGSCSWSSRGASVFASPTAAASTATSGRHRGLPSSDCSPHAAGAATWAAGTPPSGAGRQRVGLTAIVDGVLYLGSFRDASDADACRRLGIRAYLCVAGDLPQPTPRHALLAEPQFPAPADASDATGTAADGAVENVARHLPPTAAPPMATLHLGMRDAMDVSLADFAPAACAFIDAQAAAGRPVALYCQAGRSRSVAIAAAYVMHRTGLDGAAALRYVAQRYARADPNIAFVGQLVTPVEDSIIPHRGVSPLPPPPATR
jgi:hypothetical protein